MKRVVIRNHKLLHARYSNGHQCEYCVRLFLSRSALVIHHRWKHPGSKLLAMISDTKCEYCPYEAANRVSLLRHVKHHEDGTEELTCPVCWAIFSMPFHLKRHFVDDHPGNAVVEAVLKRYWQCNKCAFNVGIHLLESYKRHVEVHASGRVMSQCDICFEFVANKFTLTRHVKSQHPN